MLNENCLVWNVWGLNSRARRNVVRELVDQESISLLSLQETKLEICLLDLVREICGASFAYFFQPASNTCGGILLAWRSNIWLVTNPLSRSHSLTAQVTMLQNDETWWLTCVYGPQTDQEKIFFLDKLREVRATCSGTWSVRGDFNLIYQAEDKNNHRLNRRMMCHFRQFLNDVELQELYLKGRLYTWSIERDNLMLERLDRVFISEDWADSFQIMTYRHWQLSALIMRHFYSKLIVPFHTLSASALKTSG